MTEALPIPVIGLIFLGFLGVFALLGVVGVKVLLFIIDKIDAFLDRRRAGTNSFWRVIFAVTNELCGDEDLETPDYNPLKTE